MINIYRADQEIGVALFDDKGKFSYAERCSHERMIALVNAFPSTQFRLFVAEDSEHLIEDTFEYLPHIETLTRVTTVKGLDVLDTLKSLNRKDTGKRNNLLIYSALGVLLGCVILIPTSNEYKNSVLEQAKVMQEYTAAKPTESKDATKLSDSIDALYDEYKVEAVYFSGSSYKVIFTSDNGELSFSDFSEFPDSTLTLELALTDEDSEEEIFIYRLEGEI